MREASIGALLAFVLGLAAGAGVFVGAVLALVARFGHRTVGALMSIGAGLLISLASSHVALEARVEVGAPLTVAAVLAGAMSFSLGNAAFQKARHRKRCGECHPQPSEAAAPGSGTSILFGTALDAVPEALILGVTLRASGPDPVLIAALALSNVPEALAATSGMRLASRSNGYVLRVWTAVALGTAATTALGFFFAGDLGADMTILLKAFGAGALIAMAAETMIPEAFHDGPRYSGLLAAGGFSTFTLLGEIVR